jgi:hypothetical protein
VSPRRNLGLVLLFLAVLLYVSVASPAYDEAAQARAQEVRAQASMGEATRRLADVERRAAFLSRAMTLMSQAGASRGQDSIQRVRAGVVRTLREVGVSHARLEVRPAGSPALAEVSLFAEGAFFDLLRLVSQLDRPGSGLVLLRVSFSDPYSMTVDAVAIGAAP